MLMKASAPKRSRWVLAALTASMIGMTAILIGVIIYWLASPEPFDPLTFDTVKVQAVEADGTIRIPQVQDVDAPSVYADEPVPLVFSFCSSATDEFTATGNSWFVDATHGTRYVLNEGIESTIRPTCVSPRLNVEIPAQVRADLLDYASGEGPSGTASPWYIEGELTPNQDGGVTATWRSQVFFIVADTAD